MYFRSHLRLLGSAGLLQDLRIGSFNTGSGAYLAAVTPATTIFSGMPFETHTLIDPKAKDRALDMVVKDVRIQQELPIWAIDQGHVYSLGTGVLDVLDVRYFSDPTDSLNLGEHKLTWWKYETTATGQQLRIYPALLASYQLVIDALLAVSLGAGDLATVNLLDDKQVLWGAAAHCYWQLEQKSPAQEAGQYRDRRREAAREHSKLAARFQPPSSRKIQLDEVW